MKKVVIRENMKRWDRFRINHLVIVWMFLTFGLILFLFITSNQYAAADNQQGGLTSKILRCHRYADQMQSGSDTLTNAIWRFAATEQVMYAEDYLTELTKVKSRDRAIEQIKEENTTANELEQIEKAKQISDELKDKELYYMHLLYEGIGITEVPEEVRAYALTEEDQQLSAYELKYKARAFVFGQEYLKTKEEITVRVSKFGSDLTSRLEGELREATAATQQARNLMFAALWVLVIWSIVFWVIFRHSIVHPMRACMEELREENREQPLVLRGPYELRALIGAFNAALAWLKDKNEEIYKIKMEDPVTGGFTTARFDLEAEGYLKEHRLFTFVTMDIKRFKLINELYGEEVGNQVLRKVYKVICTWLRPGEFATRSRADIFNVVLQEDSQERLEQRVGVITNAITEAFQDEKWHKYHLAMNCGVYQVQKDDRDITTIRGRANVARKKYKKESALLSPCLFYSEGERERLITEQRIENQMEHALAGEEFQVYLQPKVSLKDERIVGAEALVRWKTQEGRMIPPGEFIPLFEENGFIIQLDYYMFRHVCALLRCWIDSGREPIPISVNLSREHIKEPGFVKRFQKIQQEYQVPPKYIEFEVTEAMVVENIEMLKGVVEEFNAAGYRCSMDDFGSGYSSLNMLREIPLDVLKLDRDFFTGKDSERGDNVVKAVLKMAQELNMQTVAEGVETRELVEFLKKEGCDMVQGYVFYRPMPIEEFEKEVFK